MAPQQTFYGSVPMESQKEEKPSRFLRRALVTTGVVVLVSLAIFTATTATQKSSSVTDIKEIPKESLRSAHPGDNLVMWKPDCQCRYGKCPKKADADGKTRCGVTVRGCMGADYGAAVDSKFKSVRYNKDVDCTKEGAGKTDADSPCRAVCDVVFGRNQCDKFPCENGGWCKDGKDSFKCFCKPGWSGDTCAINIDECAFKNTAKQVCNNYAACKDTQGAYTCKCNQGFRGEGYMDPKKVAVPSWMEKIYADNKDSKGFDYGCHDINDCEEVPGRCANGGTCINEFGKTGEHAFKCRCPRGKRTGQPLFLDGSNCKMNVNECDRNTHDCDPNAKCLDQVGGGPSGDGFMCECKTHWESEDPAGIDHHGRVKKIQMTGAVCRCDKATCTNGMVKNSCASFERFPKCATWGTKEATADKCACIGDSQAECKPQAAGCYDIDDCSKDKTLPCQNGGTCFEGLPGCIDPATGQGVDCYSCKCVVGWSGKNCDEDENECSDSNVEPPCLEGAANCPKQKTFTPLAPCKGLPSATCVNTAGSYGCRCNLGWTGDGIVCVDANDCEFSPCAHGGTCTDCGTLCFSCNCVLGWRGTTCGTDWNECLMGIHRCNDAATCVNSPGSYACRCDPGYTGNGIGSAWVESVTFKLNGADKTTNIQHGCVDIDDCANAEYEGTDKIPGWDKTWNQGPCQYGTCTDIGANAYHCKCWDGWTDSNCDLNVNECDSQTGSSECHQFASCIDLPGAGNPAPKKKVLTGAKCNAAKSKFPDDAKCAAANMGKAIVGALCFEKDADKCTKIECCAKPSSCRDAKSPFNTNQKCRDVGMGKRMPQKTMCLDKDPSKCTKDECCTKPSQYKCKCNEGFEGDGFRCKDIQDCKKNACTGRGYCSDLGVSQFKCSCDHGWQDSDCSKNQNECTDFTHGCGDNAVCVDTAGSYLCQCPKGFVGYHPLNPRSIPIGASCVDINDCGGANDLGKCANAESCTDGGVNLYTCLCKAGWTDYDCNFDVNECLGAHNCWTGGNSHELHHKNLGYTVTYKAAKCVNTPGSYECQCPKGMIGHGLKTTKVESVTNGAYYAMKAKLGHENVEKLPTGCVDYDDCRTIGNDKLWHTNDKDGSEKFNKFKCSETNPERGKCVDTGANSYRCDCAKGWGCGSAAGCDSDCNECTDGTNDCSAHATCQNTLAAITGNGKVADGFECRCKWPDAKAGGQNEGSNIPGFYGSKGGKGKSGACAPCTICGHGFRAMGICKFTDRTCVDIKECDGEVWYEKNDQKRVGNPCSKDATCANSEGSFSCKCNDGFFASTLALDARRPKFEDINSRGCTKCTVCRDGFHVVTPCTRLSDTVCERDVPAYVPARRQNGRTVPFDANRNSGIVIIKTEADENLQCLTINKDSWYPSRVDFGGVGQCGAPSEKEWTSLKPRVLWSFTGLGDNSALDEGLGRTNLYLIRYGGNNGPCLFFGDSGKSLYPSLQHCRDSYKVGQKCPWSNSKGAYCGFISNRAGQSQRDGLLANRQAVWKVTTLKLSEDKFILQSAAKDSGKAGKGKFDCLVFEKQGTETNPSRYNWGNGDRMCGVGNWGDTTLAMALMNNKQAVFILESYTKFQHSKYQILKHTAWHARRAKDVKAAALKAARK